MIQDALFELSKLRFRTFEELEEWMSETFQGFIGADLGELNKTHVGFLVCNDRILLIFEETENGYRFSSAELTAYAILQEERDAE